MYNDICRRKQLTRFFMSVQFKEAMYEPKRRGSDLVLIKNSTHDGIVSHYDICFFSSNSTEITRIYPCVTFHVQTSFGTTSITFLEFRCIEFRNEIDDVVEPISGLELDVEDADDDDDDEDDEDDNVDKPDLDGDDDDEDSDRKDISHDEDDEDDED